MKEMIHPHDYNSYESSIHSTANATARAVVIEGLPDEQRTSPIRRTFLLFVLFDFIGSFIMWALYTQLMGFSSIQEALKQEVVEYSFRTSMFDMTILALWRLVVLELSYGILKFNKPWSAAVATTGTCIFCLVKIFYYDFQHRFVQIKGSDIFDYILVITSFVLTWIETWFLDFRVLPKERAAREINAIDEAAPLLRNRNVLPGFAPSERYFSPVGSSSGSETGERIHSGTFATPTTSEFDVRTGQRLAAEAYAAAMQAAEDSDQWRVDSRRTGVGVVYTRRSPSSRRNIYKLVGEVELPPAALYHDMVENTAECPQWNPTVAETRRVQMIDDNTDVLYSVVKEALRGAVSSRDFVDIRRWVALDDGRLIVTSASVDHPACPRVREHVRGFNGPSCIALEPTEDGRPDRTLMTWVVDSDIKGWIPSRLVDQAMSSVLLDFMQALHERAVVLRRDLSLSINEDAADNFLSSKSSPA